MALCDPYMDRCEAGLKIVREKAHNTPVITDDYHEVLKNPAVEAVLVCTSWEAHTKVAIAAMRAGKIVGMEVGGVETLEECRELVACYEETKTPFMFLENCCFGKNELLTLNMARANVFGEIVYCHGAYAHDLREEVSTGKEKRHYRLNHYLTRNCENYPTHELGPIAKILDINRGNRFVRLVSVASKSEGLKRYIHDREDTFENKELIGREFKQGDIVDTIITCENGETISIRLDTTLPRRYSRELTIRGTKGMFEENTYNVFLDGEREEADNLKYYKEHMGNAKKYEEQYLPDYWKNITEEEIALGHGGMDVFSFTAFFNAIRNHAPMPIDVYDAAAWMCITVLSEQSIAGGNIPVDIPDFTNGRWKTRERLDIH